MKAILIFCLMAFAEYTVLGQTEEPSLLQIEQKRTDAILAHQEDFLSSLYDETYQGVSSSGGQVSREEQLSVYKARNNFIQFSYVDVRATSSGNMAVVTGRQIAKSKAGSVIGEVIYLLIYGKREGKWKVVMSQETDVIGR